MVAAVGFAIYGEVLDFWTWIGTAVIVGSTFYIARREAITAKKSATELSSASPLQ
jgi:drug/metabolite transporter (DMT)-like permease